MSGPKSNGYNFRSERLRQQKAARRVEKIRQQMVARQKRKAEGLLRLQSAQLNLVHISKRFTILQKQHPEEFIEIPYFCSSGSPPSDLEELESLASHMEEAVSAAERQLLLQRIRISTLELKEFEGNIQRSMTEFPDEDFNIDLSLPEKPDQNSLQALETFHQQLDHTLREGRQALKLTINKAKTKASLLASLRSILAALPEESLGASVPDPPLKVDTLTKEQLDKVLKPLDNHRREEWPQEILAAIAAFNDPALVTPTNLLLLELRSKIQSFLEEEKQRVADREEAKTMLVELSSSSSSKDQPLLDTIVERLYRVINDQERMTDDLRQTITDIHESAERTFDRQIAGEVIKDTLEELGYLIGESFSTLFVEGGAVHFQRPAWGNYYVRMRINPHTEEMRVHLLKENLSDIEPVIDREEDTAMEEAWCGDYANLMQTLQAKGIETQSLHRLPPGAVPVPLMYPGNNAPSREAQSRRDRSNLHQKKRHIF